jgi:plastocyanin
MMKKIYVILCFLAVSFVASATIHTVAVSDFAFTPANINAGCGDTVVWIWMSGTHTTTSTAIPSCANSWSSPIDINNGSFQYVIPCAGSYHYQCNIHTTMQGTINATCATGIPEIGSTPVIGVFPNPFTSDVTVSFKSSASRLVVYNILGKVVFDMGLEANDSSCHLNMADLPKGIYLLRLYDGGAIVSTRKIEKQ